MKIIDVGQGLNKAVMGNMATRQNQLPTEWAMSTYAPGFPIQPFVSPSETEIPREIDYPISVNASLQPRTGYGLMSFGSLKDVYETITEVRMPVATSLRHLTGFIPKLVDDDGNEIDDHPYSWLTTSPDRTMPFDVWLTRFMKSSDIFDAGCFSIERQDGKVSALHYLDGSTIFVIIDEHGRIPQPRDFNPSVASTTAYAKKLIEYNSKHPGKLKSRLTKSDAGKPMVITPAFAQVIKGTPFAWYSADEVWYKPRSTRYDAPYGETFIEQAWAWIMIIANITGFELAHYREGNMPEGWWETPEGWTLDRISAYEAAWNSRMSAGPSERMRSRFAMSGMKWHETKKADFPDKLYAKAFNNLVLTFGYPPSEFGEMSGKGLGGKDLGDLLQDKTFRNAIVPRKTYLEDALNNVLEMDGVDDVTLELELPQQNLDPEKEKQGVYDGVAHGVFTPNDALGRLGFDPIEGSMIEQKDGTFSPDHSNIGNKHLIIAGTTIYVLEDMVVSGGIATPAVGAKPGQAAEEALPLVPKAEKPATKADFEAQREIAKKILSEGKLPSSTKFISIPSPEVVQELSKASQSIPPGVDDNQYIMGMKEEQEHSETVGGDQSVISQIVLDHLSEDPLYYTHLAEIHAKAGDTNKFVKLSASDLQKHCGVCEEDEAYFGAPIANDVKFELPVGHHANEVDIVAMMPDGLPSKPALWKPEGGELEGIRQMIGGPLYTREEAAYLLDRALGFDLVPVAYVAQSDAGEMGAVVFYSIGSSDAKPVDSYSLEWVERAAVLDYIMSQLDRNTGNWFTHPDDPGRMILIDNSFSFPVDPSLFCQSPFCAAMVNKLLSESTLVAINMLLGDEATWRDIKALVGSPATEKARECAQRLADNKMVTHYDGDEERPFVSSPAEDMTVD